MDELPPRIHGGRDRMIDVHPTILARTHRKTPDPLAMLADAVPAPDGFAVLCPADMACHCAAHLLADGDLQGGLRNLWDFHCMTRDFAAADPDFREKLHARACQHGMRAAVHHAPRLARSPYERELPANRSQARLGAMACGSQSTYLWG